MLPGEMRHSDRVPRITASLAATGMLCLALTLLVVRLDLAESVGLWLKFSYLLPPLALIGPCWAIARAGLSPWAHAVTLVCVACVSTLILVGIWRAGVSDGFILGGLLPYSDAHSYYGDALRLLSGRTFSVFSSRRPLFATYLAGLLALTDFDLRITLALLTGISLVTIGVAVREMRRSLGPGAAVFLLLCLFMFYRRYIGATLSEHLGIAFGCLAFGLIWRGAATIRVGPVFAGLFLLCLGLNARAGAFLVLPAVAGWAAWDLRGPNRTALRIVGGSLAAILLGFAVNSLVLHWVALPGAAHSNFAYVLYGLVFGGNWGLALQQHPELAALPPLDQAHQVYALAWEQIRAHPLSLVTGCLNAWKAFFLARSGAWFSFILYLSPFWADVRATLLTDGLAVFKLGRDAWILLDVAVREVWIVGLNGLLVAGLLVAARNWRRRLVRLVAAAWVGTLLSVPFVPPWDADNMRAYAATLPFVVALPMLGLLYRRGGDAAWGETGEASRSRRRAGVWVCAGLLLCLQGLGLFLVGTSEALKPPRMPAASCVAACDPVGHGLALHVDPRTAVHLVETRPADGDGRAGQFLDLGRLREWESARRHSLWHMWRGISRLPDRTTLALGFDTQRGGVIYLRSSAREFPGAPGRVAVCGQTVKEAWIEWFDVRAWASCGGR
jgi:hypothetical protein